MVKQRCGACEGSMVKQRYSVEGGKIRTHEGRRMWHEERKIIIVFREPERKESSNREC